MNINDLQTLLNDYCNNNSQSLTYFYDRNDYRTNLDLIIKTLRDELLLENGIFRVQSVLVNKIQQIIAERDNFNNIVRGNVDNIIYIDPDNRWNALYNNTTHLVRSLNGIMGLLLIDYAEINMNNVFIDRVINELGIANILNIHNNQMNHNHNQL
jgi:hypothetical protein